jgi:hypothetical protein
MKYSARAIAILPLVHAQHVFTFFMSHHRWNLSDLLDPSRTFYSVATVRCNSQKFAGWKRSETSVLRRHNEGTPLCEPQLDQADGCGDIFIHLTRGPCCLLTQAAYSVARLDWDGINYITSFIYSFKFTLISRLTDPSDSVGEDLGVWRLACWDCGFESRRVWMSVSCVCCGVRGLCVGLITGPGESYLVLCVWLWSWSLDNEETQAH